MKYLFIISFFIISNIACNNAKNTTSSKSNSYWKQLKKDNIPNKYSAYVVYTLDEVLFRNALENGSAVIPDDLGNLNSFTIEESKTMSEELAKKFPEIKSYKGEQIDNSLCRPRIETNKTKIKLAIFCNDKTYFIDKDKELDIYIVYNKENAPNGTGVVNEK